MQRRRPFLMALLALGTIAGYGSAFASLHCGSACHHRASFEQHIADVCTDAVRRAEQR